MSVQQPVSMLPYGAAWPWSCHHAQSQMAAQAMSAAAMGVRNGPGMEGSIRKPVCPSSCAVFSAEFSLLEEAAMSMMGQAQEIVLGPIIDVLCPSTGITTLLQEQMCLSIGSAVLVSRGLTSGRALSE